MLNKAIANIIAKMPENLVWIFSKRYLAGKELSDAVKVTQELNGRGVETTMDVLGEYIHNKQEAISYKEQYLQTITAVKENGLKATISVKPTMFGLLLDKDFCFEQVREVVAYADKLGMSICLDMEDSTCTGMEVEMFERLYTEFPASITFVLQAYMRRTLEDLKRLAKVNNPQSPINIRICKGIYIEPEEVAYQKKEEVRNNYLSCLNYMLENGFFCSIATHDTHLVKGAKALLEKYQVESHRYEFQMLFGVRPKLRGRLVEQKHPLRVYVPYGVHWFGYSIRRLQENPKMVTHIIKSLFIRG